MTISSLTAPQTGDARSSDALATSVTSQASKQSYFTIRFLVDRDRVQDAFRAYAYFRWVDDRIDERGPDVLERLLFAERQKALLEHCRRGEQLGHLADEEWMLVDLLRSQGAHQRGLWAYLDQMMAVMTFDAGRRGRLISAAELNAYTNHLAIAVTEALHYFIGNGSRSAVGEVRYAAVTGAHITHMLRDTLDDVQAGYFNIPREFLESQGIGPADLNAPAYREWVGRRVALAKAYLRAGTTSLGQAGSLRFRLAGSAYIARFLVVLDTIQRDGYLLQATYQERKGITGGLKLSGLVLSQAVNYHFAQATGQLGDG